MHLLDQLKALRNQTEAQRMAAYHKVEREYLGVRVPIITDLARVFWMSEDSVHYIEVCEFLWESNIHEARILVGKILGFRTLKSTDQAWAFLHRAKFDFDAWAIVDHLEAVARQCLVADRTRMDEIEENWLSDESFWIRRASLVYTLFLAKKGQDPERPLSWAASMVDDREWFIQKAIGWWLRELSKHNPKRVQVFLREYKSRMKRFAVKEASKYL